MNGNRARSAPSWRVSDTRPMRLKLFVLAAVVMAALLTEVWQCSTVASLSEQIGRASRDLQKANAELLWHRSQLERSSNRSAVGPMAGAIGLRPADPQRIVLLPEEFLEPAESRGGAAAGGWLAWAGRAAGALVPEASAHGRRVN